jgi:metal transporter CNNM
MPLYDILNEFQKGGSHMAAVTKVKNAKKRGDPPQSENLNGLPEVLEVHDEADLERGESKGDENGDEQAEMRIKKEEMVEENDPEEGEVIGIITLEDVMEELLQVSLKEFSQVFYCIWFF